MTDDMDMDAVRQLPQHAVDGGWQFAPGDNAGDLDIKDLETIRDVELAYENMDSGLIIVGRGHSNREAYQDALNQIDAMLG